MINGKFSTPLKGDEAVMKKFSSYGPVDKDLHYYVPREQLIRNACGRLLGDDPEKSGEYITIWAPRQCGKTWIMIEVLWRLMEDDRFHVLKLDLEHLKIVENTDEIVKAIVTDIIGKLNLKSVHINNLNEFKYLFKNDVLDKPLILILDEFDSLTEAAISGLTGIFRNIYNQRRYDPEPTHQKEYLLHGIALIGIRSVLGIENVKGSPFNVQRSLHIPNLTYAETDSMFKQYEQESGQKIEQQVIDRLYHETCGQPGLVSWLGELISEGFEYFQPNFAKPLTLAVFDKVYLAAVQVLPNNTILNIISKARQQPYKTLLLELFKTDEKISFKFDDQNFNFLYMNGVIDIEHNNGFFAKFSSPFVQKRLFNYFSHDLFPYMGTLYAPFEDVDDIVTETTLNVKRLMRRYEKHLRQNRAWMLKDAPRRSDLKIFEAVFHFNLYEYLVRFLGSYKSAVWPEFPTGNGKVDILIRHGGCVYALEIKSYRDKPAYQQALRQAGTYAKTLKLDTIYLIVFVDYINDEQRKQYEVQYEGKETGVIVTPLFVQTGN